MYAKLLREGARLPEKSHESDAGYDCYLPKPVSIASGHFKKIPLGISIELPRGWFGFITDRSSMANKGLFTVGGVIDNGYRGEIHCIMYNFSDEIVRLEEGTRVCQLIPILTAPVIQPSQEGVYASYPKKFLEVSRHEDTDRGTAGFGSTGD